MPANVAGDSVWLLCVAPVVSNETGPLHLKPCRQTVSFFGTTTVVAHQPDGSTILERLKSHNLVSMQGLPKVVLLLLLSG